MLIERGLYGGVIDNPIKINLLWPLMFNGKGWIFLCEISTKNNDWYGLRLWESCIMAFIPQPQTRKSTHEVNKRT